MNLKEQATRPQPDNTRRIPLSQGQFAIVDASNYDWLIQWKWYAQWNPKTRSFYAVRTLIHGSIQIYCPRLHRRNGDGWQRSA